MKKAIAAAACLMAAAWAAEAGDGRPQDAAALKVRVVDVSLGQLLGPERLLGIRKIDLSDLTRTPIGDFYWERDEFDVPMEGSELVECQVPPEWTKGGECAALRTSGLLLERKTLKIVGALGSCAYPTIAEGAKAVTNEIRAAVMKTTGGRAKVVPLKLEKDGSGTVRHEWVANGATVELLVKCYANARRQMAVCCLLHVKGDSIAARLAPR